MTTSIDNLLEDTDLDSSGSFTLSVSRARQLLSMNDDGPCWGFYQLVQAAVKWGAESITFPERGNEWSVVLGNPLEFPNPGRLRADVVELGLASDGTGERLVASAALRMGVVELQVSWGGGGQLLGTALLMGPSRAAKPLPRTSGWICIRLKLREHRTVPWGGLHRCAYAPLEIRIGRWHRPTRPGQSSWFGPDGHFWLEYFRTTESTSGFYLNPSGGTGKELGSPCPRIFGRRTSDLRWKQADGKGDLLILVRWGFEGVTRFHAVQAGILVCWRECPELPPGFEILFDANGLETDLSDRKLVDSDRLKERLRSYLPEIVQASRVLEMNASSLTRKTPWYIANVPFLNIIFVMGWLCVFQLTVAGLLVGGFFAVLTTWAFAMMIRDYWREWSPFYKDLKHHLSEATKRWSEVSKDWPA
jgi:hypothetical protein